jgi:hypothetical protein
MPHVPHSAALLAEMRAARETPRHMIAVLAAGVYL